jgi:hypothetical protein
MRFRVVWGFGDVIAIFAPIMRLSSVDFPTFGRPMMAAKTDFVAKGISVLCNLIALFPHP